MTTTKPTSEQLRFTSSKTGEHSLDTYLEAAEKGNRTLPNLLDDIFNTAGALRPDLFELRITAAGQLEFRFGLYANPAAAWTPVVDGEIFRMRGPHANATAYKRLDMVTHANGVYICVAAHTSASATPSAINFYLAIDPISLIAPAVRHDVAQALAAPAQAQARANIDAAPTAHTHAIADVTALQTTLDAKAPASHTHTIANTTGLQAALDGKAPTSHTHPSTQISDATVTGRAVLTAADAAEALTILDAAPTAHTHTRADISDASAFGRTLLDRADDAAARSVLSTLSASEITSIGARSSLRNRITNGAMQIAQERGTTAVDCTSGNTYAIDQWLVSLSSTPGGTLRVRQALNSAGADSWARLRSTVQVADTSLAANDFYMISQPIEGVEIADARLGNAGARPLILRFMVNSSVAGTYTAHLRNPSPVTHTWLGTFTITVPNVDTWVTLQIPAGVLGAWPNDTNVGAWLGVTLACGSTLQSSSLGWQAGGFIAHSSQVNFMATLNATFELTNVALYVDRVSAGLGIPPGWELPDMREELQKCLRYWRRAGNSAVGGWLSASRAYLLFGIDPPMRVAPTAVSIGVPIPVNEMGVGTRTATPTFSSVATTPTAFSGSLDGYSGAITSNPAGALDDFVILDARF